MSLVIQSVAKKTRKADHSTAMFRMFVMQICVPYHCEVIGQNNWMPPKPANRSHSSECWIKDAKTVTACFL